MCRWLNYNVFGVSHVSSYYANALQIVHIVMIKDKHYCMCRQLLDTITNFKKRRKTFLPLPILVTQICREWMIIDEFNNAMYDRVGISHEVISASYRASL